MFIIIIELGIHIVQDGCSAYNFLDGNYAYSHETFNHDTDNFGNGSHRHPILQQYGVGLNQK